jgi:SAM-dependent methyltransferase
MVDLSRRIDEPELLDLGVSDEEARRSLADLRFVNRWLGNRQRFLRTLRPYLAVHPRTARLLDVGCGSGDVPAFVVAGAGVPVLAVGLDAKELHLRALPPTVKPVRGDVRALPFAPGSFDVVTASLFLHHFGDQELPEVLRGLWRLARRALVVNDLRRARVPYVFGQATFRLLFRTHVSVEDGLLSIRRGFTPGELAAAFATAGIPARVRREFPYRLVAVAEKAP